MILLTYCWANCARNFESNSKNAPKMSILTDKCMTKICYKGKSDSENQKIVRRGEVINLHEKGLTEKGPAVA